MPTMNDLLLLQGRVAGLMERIDHAEDDAERVELQAEINSLLDGLPEAEADKLDAYRAVYLRLSSLGEEARAESRRLAERARMLSGHADSIRDRAQRLLVGRRDRMGDDYRLQTPTATYRLQRAGKPRVVGPDDLACWVKQGWFRIKEEPDRTTAGEALAGMEPEEWPEGFALETTETIRW
jgi:hypothetical protein